MGLDRGWGSSSSPYVPIGGGLGEYVGQKYILLTPSPAPMHIPTSSGFSLDKIRVGF